MGIALDPRAKNADRVAACNSLFNRGLGAPLQATLVGHVHQDGGPQALGGMERWTAEEIAEARDLLGQLKALRARVERRICPPLRLPIPYADTTPEDPGHGDH